MQLSRRRFLWVIGGVTVSVPFVALASGCSAAPGEVVPSATATAGSGGFEALDEVGQTGRVLRSQTARPTPFTRPLPLPSPLVPVRTGSDGDDYELVARRGTAQILDERETPVWGFDGTFPGPLFETRRGRAANVRLTNELPVPIVRHLHGAFTPAASDGYPLDYVLPVSGPGDHHLHPGGTVHDGSFTYAHPMQQRAALLWYHDHRMDFTGPQVWAGLAGLHVHRDDEERALGLPVGDHELTLLLTDRSFAADGSFLYPALDPDLAHTPGVLEPFANGVLGDTLLVNGIHAPYHRVKQGTYRLRIANGSNAREYRLSVDPLPPTGEPFVQIGTDGGLMAAPAVRRSLSLAPAERVDVVADFTGYPEGSVVRLTNLAGGDGTTDVIEFRVGGKDDRPRWIAPDVLSQIEVLNAADAVRTRTFAFARVPTSDGVQFHIGHRAFDPDAIEADPRAGETEIWEFSSDLAHPVHIHNAHFQVLDAGGPTAWKDVVRLGPRDKKRVIVRFDSYPGTYVFHCHNLEHEDMGMMANFVIG
ncbi:multicopper oxidase family protein [Microbacterium sp.]|uniref:multicopper oxidase family protein n=1 Tax=Microbacterium sp. TaxID=51671 RepID=UPI003C72A4EB